MSIHYGASKKPKICVNDIAGKAVKYQAFKRKIQFTGLEIVAYED